MGKGRSIGPNKGTLPLSASEPWFTVRIQHICFAFCCFLCLRMNLCTIQCLCRAHLLFSALVHRWWYVFLDTFLPRPSSRLSQWGCLQCHKGHNANCGWAQFSWSVCLQYEFHHMASALTYLVQSRTKMVSLIEMKEHGFIRSRAIDTQGEATDSDHSKLKNK